MIDKACLSATDLPSVTLTLTSASPSETFRPGCNLIPLFNLFLNKMFPARAWTASRSSRSCPTEWSGWSAWGTWSPSPPPRSSDSHLAFFQFWILSFPGSDREADPPAMPDRGRPLPVQRARQGEHLPSVSLCRFDKPRFETDEKCSRCGTTFFDRNWLSFSDLDPRVRTLGYMVKLFAKVAFSNFQEGQW